MFLIPLADSAPDPALVRPGAGALVVFIFLVVAGFFLFRSMRKQLNRVDFDDSEPIAKKTQDRPEES